MQLNILQAKNRLSELIRSVRAGQEVVIANRGKPVARLVAASPADTADASGSAESILAWLASNPLPDHARRSAAEIEADILTERNAWD